MVKEREIVAQNVKKECVLGSAESHWLGLGFEG